MKRKTRKEKEKRNLSTKDTKGTKSPPTLEGLLAGITEENVHPETDSGAPVGKEV